MSELQMAQPLAASTLLADLGVDSVLPAVADVQPVRGLTDDSRAVTPGMAFLAVRGAVSDGHEHINAAIAAGAVLVLAETSQPPGPVPVVVVPELARLRSELAGRCFRHPSRAQRLCAITGTNGKTSVAHYCAQLFEQLGTPCGYLGTVGWGRLDALRSARLTTADAISIQARLALLRAEGVEVVALEASSHALAQDRLAALDVDVAVLTNLSRDHLDYHGDMKRYAAAKRRLFDRPELRQLILNADDSFGQELSTGELTARMRSPERAPAQLCLYGQEVDRSLAEHTLSWRELKLHSAGIAGHWQTSWGEQPFALPLLGEFAVANVAAAMAVALAAGHRLRDVAVAAEQLHGVPGRMERFVAKGQPTVIVDYAHTPDALDNVLRSLRGHSTAKLHLVFGCGGDRDRGKRPQMAAVAAQRADRLYLTSDNPRTEDPEQIIDDMAAGLPSQVSSYRICDRRQAIETALSEASPSDLVLIAGKGHEDYQEIGAERLYFSDRDLVRSLLEEAA